MLNALLRLRYDGDIRRYGDSAARHTSASARDR